MNESAPYEFLGFGIGGYRCFTSDQQALVGPFGKVHLITGQNNSGKSALANIAYHVLPSLRRGGAINWDKRPFIDRDLPQGVPQTSNTNITLSLCFSRDSLLSGIGDKQYRDRPAKNVLEKALSSNLASREEEGACWLDFDIPAEFKATNQKRLTLSEQFAEKLSEECGTNFSDASLAIASQGSGSPTDNLSRIVRELIPWDSIPPVIKVGAIRYVTDDAEPDNHVVSGGEGLIKELRRLRMPNVGEQFVNQKKWARFERFVRDILNDPEAEINTDADATAILVKSGTPGFLELSDLGTGIEELVIIAAVVACNDNKLIIVEEPEIHLHPTLQSKLIRHFLDDENGNRFLITTHSPSIINTPGVTITQVTNIGGKSTASQVRGIVDARNVLDDIGAKPSDLLQSNYVIWVEGPSDRIYVNYWLSVVAPDLSEGTHYSVMMYGGRLLNSCSADIPGDDDDLIALFRVNTHFCVLMDSDREKKRARLNSTKLRIKKECEASGNFSWVTDGRTIENYVPAEVLRCALDALYPNKTYDWELGEEYICPLSGKFKGKTYRPDKIRVARKVAELGHELSPELQKYLNKLTKMIREANGM